MNIQHLDQIKPPTIPPTYVSRASNDDIIGEKAKKKNNKTFSKVKSAKL
jgi:hypothetical protein